MNNDIFLIVLSSAMVLAFGGFAVKMVIKQQELRKKHPGYPVGYWQGRGMAVGIAIGTATGLAIGNLAIGVGVGVAIGAGLGMSNEKKHKDEIRPLIEEERQLRKQRVLFFSVIFLLGVLVFVMTSLMNK